MGHRGGQCFLNPMIFTAVKCFLISKRGDTKGRQCLKAGNSLPMLVREQEPHKWGGTKALSGEIAGKRHNLDIMLLH